MFDPFANDPRFVDIVSGYLIEKGEYGGYTVSYHGFVEAHCETEAEARKFVAEVEFMPVTM